MEYEIHMEYIRYTSLYIIIHYITVLYNIIHMDTYGHIVKVCKDVRTPHRSCEFGRRCD